ncbi:MAG: hypothetical protein KBS98_08510 [Flavobacterium sp.]|nr:hypothetical protein [Candidatus Neoflavobacterium equi]
MKTINKYLWWSIAGLILVNLLYLINLTGRVFPTFGQSVLEYITYPILALAFFLFGYGAFEVVKRKRLEPSYVLLLLIINGLTIVEVLLNWNVV